MRMEEEVQYIQNEYRKFWIGRCVDTGATTNLVIGELYLLKDKTGRQDHYNVSKYISNNDAFIGSYRGTYFQVEEDVTEAIKAMPHERGVFKYDMYVGTVRMVAQEKNMSFEDAQNYLIRKGTIDKAVVDQIGKSLKTHATIYEPEKIVTPESINLVVDELPEEFRLDAKKDIMPRGTAKSDTFDEDLTYEPPKPKATKPAPKPKPPEKAKFVQRGLFG